jgi:hypothetical protein
MIRPSLLWSLFKLLLVASSAVPLLFSDNTFTCTTPAAITSGGYYDCSAFCFYDKDNDISCTQAPQDEFGTNYNPEYCNGANTHSVNTYMRNGTYYCSATVDSICYDYNYYILLSIYVVQFSVCLLMALLYKDFDLQSDMVAIANKYDISSDTLTTLLHPVICLLAMIDASALYVAVASVDMSYASCDGTYNYPTGTLKLMLVLSVVIAELYTPVAIHVMNVFINPDSTIREKLIAPVKIDLLISCTILRMMQVICWPAAVLSYVSIKKRNRANERHEKVNLLAMDVRDSFTLHVLAGGAFHGRWTVMNVLRTLSSRYTVQYSFAKLIVAILLSFALNTDYMYCNDPQHSFTEDECASDCRAHCVFPKKKSDDYYPEHSHHCYEVDHMCFCENWLMTDLTAILLNTVHFILQCYYLLHYNNFDPQQNQIDCVQSYTFVGENITLFLTHPAICFLSVLECAVLYVSWNAVILELGVVCGSEVAGDNIGSSFLFAMLMTILEVYKANMTVAFNEIKDRSYLWAVFSMFRVDIFIFFGATLFLQTCLFPFSIIGYFTVGGKFDPTIGRESIVLTRETDSVIHLDSESKYDSYAGSPNRPSLKDPLLETEVDETM